MSNIPSTAIPDYYIGTLQWSPDATDDEKNIVIGNLRGFYAWLQKPAPAHPEGLRDLLINVAQLLDGWHQDGTAWTEWDESVRRKVSEALSEMEEKK